MAQGCWSVVPVCATSYSWKTGPHWGTMESPQTAAGTRDSATPMVAVQAENGSTNLAGIRSPGIGPDGRLVQMSAKIPLRGCEPLGFRRWVAAFARGIGSSGKHTSFIDLVPAFSSRYIFPAPKPVHN